VPGGGGAGGGGGAECAVTARESVTADDGDESDDSP
jgi:hypothetical protein